MDGFTEIDVKDLQFNPFEMIGADWMLVTAGNDSAWNTMTAAWGQMGYLWDTDVATIYVRPQRYTKEFIDQTDDFTLSFFGEEWREALETCGKTSGRDTDKALATGLTAQPAGESVAFAQAQLVFVCHKLYQQPLDPAGFIAEELKDVHYPQNDFHTMYVGRIDKVLIADELLEEDDSCECGCDHDHDHGEDCCHNH